MPSTDLCPCRRSFIVSEKYQGRVREVRYVRGRTYVAPDHPIIKLHPDCFGPAAAAREGNRERTRATFDPGAATLKSRTPARSGNRYGAEPWRIHSSSPRCAYRDATGHVGVRLAASARADLIEILDMTTSKDGLEVGVLGLGPEPRRGELIEILGVIPTGPGSERARGSVRFDAQRDLDLADRVREHTSGSFVVNSVVHSHPSQWRAPSIGDLAFLSAARSAFAVAALGALIATRSDSDSGWQLDAYIARPMHGSERELVQRARLS